MDHALELRGLLALESFDLVVPPGESFGLLGPNGRARPR